MVWLAPTTTRRIPLTRHSRPGGNPRIIEEMGLDWLASLFGRIFRTMPWRGDMRYRVMRYRVMLAWA